MKKKLTILLAIIGVTAFSSSGFAIDDVVHAVVDAATGAHHQQYYDYDRGGHRDDHYGRRYYRQTNYQGGHRYHHNQGAARFSIGRGHDRDHHDRDHDRGHNRGHNRHHDRDHDGGHDEH